MNSMSYCELFIIITVFIFKRFTNRGKASAGLKVVRVALNNFMSHSVQGSSDRGVSFIYLSFSLSSITFQSNLSSLLISPILALYP